MRTCFLLGLLALYVAGSDVSLEGVAKRLVPDPLPEPLDQLALMLVGRVAHMRPDAAISASVSARTSLSQAVEEATATHRWKRDSWPTGWPRIRCTIARIARLGLTRLSPTLTGPYGISS